MRYSERTHFLLTPAQREKVQRDAARTGRSVSAVIRDAIDVYGVDPDVARRLEALERLFAIECPAEDWEVTEAKIAEARMDGLPEIDDPAD